MASKVPDYVRETIAAAAGEGIDLSISDFTVFDGDWYLDGMDPAEWLAAMLMD